MFGEKYERRGVRPRGALLSAAAFKDLPCTAEPVTVGDATYYRCGREWFQRIEHEGWTCYSEIWPPAGARVASLPSKHVRVQAGDRTVYGTDEALYTTDPAGNGYVVVEPVPGLRVERLPASATDGIPVLVNGVSYHRHLGVFYREEDGPEGRYYVVSESPFALPFGQATAAGTGTPAAATPSNAPPMTAYGYDVYGGTPPTDAWASRPSYRAAAAPPPQSEPPPSFYTGPEPAYVAPSSAPGSPGALLTPPLTGVGSPAALPPQAAPGSPHAPFAR